MAEQREVGQLAEASAESFEGSHPDTLVSLEPALPPDARGAADRRARTLICAFASLDTAASAPSQSVFMTSSSKLAALGACALLAGAGGAGLSAVVVGGHGSGGHATAAAPTPGTSRPVVDTNDSTAKDVYDASKDAVAYITAQTGQGTATG